MHRNVRIVNLRYRKHTTNQLIGNQLIGSQLKQELAETWSYVKL